MNKFSLKKNSFQFKTAQIIALGFAGVILFGTMLLSIPIAWAQGHHISFMDAFFTSTTSICVTGLVTVPTATAWSSFGKIIILLLIQLGGFGVVTCKTLVLLVMGKKVGIRSRKLIQESYNLDSLRGLIVLVRKIVLGTLIVEGAGAVLYTLVLVPEFGLVKGVSYAVFNAVSAFCNAGMDIIGENSLINYAKNPLVNFTTMGLIIMGGIGYLVWWDLIRAGKQIIKKTMDIRHALRSLELNTKIALTMTAILIFGGTFFIFILEYDNPETIGNMSIGCKLMAAMFQSVTCRTAGFLTVPQEGLREATAMVCILLMFVGGSPMGTAGGVKTTTIAVLVMSGISFFQGKDDTEIFKRRISLVNIRTAGVVFMLEIAVLFSASFAMTLAMKDASFMDILYEVVSAGATVGLTRGMTPILTAAGKSIIIGTMYIGRIGPTTLAAALAVQASHRSVKVRMAEEKVLIG